MRLSARRVLAPTPLLLPDPAMFSLANLVLTLGIARIYSALMEPPWAPRSRF
jgi:hypothetical protein